MYAFRRSSFPSWIARFGLLILTVGALGADSQDQASSKRGPELPASITTGQRVFTCGHSFHVWVPEIVADFCKLAEIPGHVQVGISSIGGSRVAQHWEIAADRNTAKDALRSGQVDVLTLSPIFLPDPGIENFTQLALEHNKDIRVVVQPIWLRWDIYEPTTKQPEKVDHNAITGEELRKRHEPHFQKMDEHLRELNQKYGKTVLYVAPAPQAVIALREKIIAGEAPGLTQQEDLFTDPLGHGKPPLMALVAYCNYAVIYRRSPVGLPVPAILKQAGLGDQEEKLNRLLQELAWEAALQHPLSGLRTSKDDVIPVAVFASIREGKELLTRHDDFVERLSPFDRAARLKSDQDVSVEQYLNFVGDNVLELTAEEKQKIQSAFQELCVKLNRLSLTVPTDLIFIKTTGKEEGGAKYTRANAIVLPESFFQLPATRMERTICHELFHVISRANPELRDKLYASIGFEKCDELGFPSELKTRKLTNPDSPKNDHCIKLKVADAECWAIPILYSDSEKYDVERGGEFFKYLKFALCLVDRSATGSGVKPQYDGRTAKLVGMEEVTGFYEQVGKNTQYILHPEEILADNFARLVMQDRDLPSPQIVVNLERILNENAASK